MRKLVSTGGALAALAIAQPLAAIPNAAVNAAWGKYEEESDENLVTLADTLECAVLIIALEDELGMSWQTDVDDIIADFDRRLAKSSYTEPQVKEALRARAAFWKGELNADDYTDWAIDVANTCDDIYVELQSRPAQPSGEPRVIDASYLRAHLEQNGDFRAVSDYIVYTFPDGSDPFTENPMGELLGEMVVTAGAKGMLTFSDAAILAMVENHYWKYNPPATRIVDAEYRRRLRVMRMTSQQASDWARRAAKDRAEQARRADAPWVGSIGGSTRSTSSSKKPCRWTTYSGTGGGTVCVEE